MTTLCVIPARYGAQRLPGKPLIPLLGRPLILWTIEAARRIEGVDAVIVATDDERIASVVRDAGAEAVMTPVDCPSGTDRIAVALRGREADIVVNVQGDEPTLPADAVRDALRALRSDPDAMVATACVPIRSRHAFDAPQNVKVVRGAGDRALYFSRSPIPSLARQDEAMLAAPGHVFGYKHLGLYIYRRAALEAFTRLPPSPVEQLEKLEQLRFLEAGMKILCVATEREAIGVDVAEDIPLAEARLREMAGGRQ